MILTGRWPTGCGCTDELLTLGTPIKQLGSMVARFVTASTGLPATWFTPCDGSMNEPMELTSNKALSPSGGFFDARTTNYVPRTMHCSPCCLTVYIVINPYTSSSPAY